jgi:hypothetical protein
MAGTTQLALPAPKARPKAAKPTRAKRGIDRQVTA